MKWTDEQKNSIFARPAEIVVSAAAGSGKTQVLTTRITERIKDTSSPVSVDKLLIVTFTKAAAAEMKERIGKSLRNAANSETNPKIKAHLKKQLSLLGGAQICTIDSFCYDIVRQNFFKVSLPSDISIGENGEFSLLKLSALEKTVDILYCALAESKGEILQEENLENARLFTKHFPDAKEAELILKGFEMLTEAFSHDKRDSDFTEKASRNGDFTDMITMLHQKSQSTAYPEKWLNYAAELYNSDAVNYEETPVHRYTFSLCKEIVCDAITTLNSLIEVSSANDIGYEASLDMDVSALKPLCEAKNYEEFYKLYNSASFFPTLKGKNKEADAEIVSQIKSVRTRTKDIIIKNLGKIMKFSLEECADTAKLLYPQIKALCMSAILLDRLYFEKLVGRRILDFSACAHLALKIISEDGITLTDTGESLKNRYDEIYVDEFQDSNNLQDILFSLISKGRTFMVGDVKQSIYGFRNADPGIFMQKCDESQFDHDAAKRKIFLSKNFRSGKSIINAVNSIFDIVMTEPVSKIDYRAEHRLEFGAEFIPESVPDEKCEISLVQKNGNSKESLNDEVNFIASKIREIIESKRLIWDKDSNTQRPVMFSDIVVLSRSINSKTKVFESAFSNAGIPCYIDGGNDLYETNEVGQIIEILKLIDNEKSDISLACALRSPMFMFNETELLKIKLCSKQSFYESFYGICAGKYDVDSSLVKKCKYFYGKLKKWRKLSLFSSIEDLIIRIYNDTSLYSNVLSFPDGQMRRANLDLLLEKAEEFERSSYSGLFNFVSYIEKMKRTAQNVSEAKALSEKMNVVRIMSIHKSKGLEFPVVFLSGCGETYYLPKTTPGGIIMSNDGSIGINVVNTVLRSKYKSPASYALSLMQSRENAAEEMRLFYVALTRAREKLYAVATIDGYDAFEKMAIGIVEKPTANEIFSCNSYISLLALAYSHGADKYWEIKQYFPKEDSEISEENIKKDFSFTENEKISKLLEFKYPYSQYINLPGKASVSLLKSFDINLAPSHDGTIPMINTPSCDKISFNKPKFEDTSSGGTFFGNAHHKFLQYFDYNGGNVKEQLHSMLNSGILTTEEFNLIDTEKIEEFCKSELGVMMKQAGTLHREEPFVIKVGANELEPTLDENEYICVQGIIDCYFEKDESTVVLVDYKTDRYDDPSTIAEKYRKQLYYYEIALKKKYNDKIIQKYLYLLHKNDIIEL